VLAFPVSHHIYSSTGGYRTVYASADDPSLASVLPALEQFADSLCSRGASRTLDHRLPIGDGHYAISRSFVHGADHVGRPRTTVHTVVFDRGADPTPEFDPFRLPELHFIDETTDVAAIPPLPREILLDEDQREWLPAHADELDRWDLDVVTAALDHSFSGVGVMALRGPMDRLHAFMRALGPFLLPTQRSRIAVISLMTPPSELVTVPTFVLVADDWPGRDEIPAIEIPAPSRSRAEDSAHGLAEPVHDQPFDLVAPGTLSAANIIRWRGNWQPDWMVTYFRFADQFGATAPTRPAEDLFFHAGMTLIETGLSYVDGTLRLVRPGRNSNLLTPMLFLAARQPAIAQHLFRRALKACVRAVAVGELARGIQRLLAWFHLVSNKDLLAPQAKQADSNGSGALSSGVYGLPGSGTTIDGRAFLIDLFDQVLGERYPEATLEVAYRDLEELLGTPGDWIDARSRAMFFQEIIETLPEIFSEPFDEALLARENRPQSLELAGMLLKIVQLANAMLPAMKQLIARLQESHNIMGRIFTFLGEAAEDADPTLSATATWLRRKYFPGM
jgi:hypothetical protein